MPFKRLFFLNNNLKKKTNQHKIKMTFFLNCAFYLKDYQRIFIYILVLFKLTCNFIIRFVKKNRQINKIKAILGFCCIIKEN